MALLVVGDYQYRRPLSDLRITKEQSSRWQRVAALPEEEFENAITEGMGETRMSRWICTFRTRARASR